MGVGKSSLLSKYVKGVVPVSPLPTIAIEFATKIIQIKEGGYIKAQIWDTAGQEKYKAITSHHYRRAVGALIVYDVTKRSSFDNVLKWYSDLKQKAEKECIIALVGNKIDLNDNRSVSFDEGKNISEKYGIMFFETSAKDNIDINELFEKSTLTYLNKNNLSKDNQFKGINLNTMIVKTDSEKSFCCF